MNRLFLKIFTIIESLQIAFYIENFIQNTLKVIFLIKAEYYIFDVDVENRDLVNVFLMLFGQPF